jgi:type IV secretion system protein VirD4
MPEENPNTFFMISLIIQQLYREILAVADEQGGVLKNRCVFFCDEFGTLPKIESAEMMFSASRSRRLQIVPIIQSFAQLDKNYGKEGAEIIVDNTQLTLFGGFAPNSASAEILSKALGSRTVMSGSVSRSKNDPTQSLQMIERPLLTPDELKSMPKGQFVVMKTGHHPMRVKLKLFFKWGIEFDKDHPYCPLENGSREVAYASKSELIDSIIQKYYPALQKNNDNIDNEDSDESGGQSQVLSNSNFAEVRTERGVDLKVSPKANEMSEREDGQMREEEKEDDDEKPEYFEEDFTVTEGYNE